MRENDLETSNQHDEPLLDLTELARAAQLGDRDALGQLCMAYRPRIMAIARRRLGNEHEAQELCQEVFVRAIMRLDQLRQPERFGAWLSSITERMAINRLVRRRPTRTTPPEDLDAACVDARTPYVRAVEGERAEHVRAGLDRLRPLDRDTLLAFYVRGESLREMSDSFSAPLGTIKRRLHVARRRLADEVEHLVGA